jgi:hypothetical protein
MYCSISFALGREPTSLHREVSEPDVEGLVPDQDLQSKQYPTI